MSPLGDGFKGVWRGATEYYENCDKNVTGGWGLGVLNIGQIGVTYNVDDP